MSVLALVPDSLLLHDKEMDLFQNVPSASARKMQCQQCNLYQTTINWTGLLAQSDSNKNWIIIITILKGEMYYIPD